MGTRDALGASAEIPPPPLPVPRRRGRPPGRAAAARGLCPAPPPNGPPLSAAAAVPSPSPSSAPAGTAGPGAADTQYARACAHASALAGRASSLRGRAAALAADNAALRARLHYCGWEAAAARLFCRVVMAAEAEALTHPQQPAPPPPPPPSAPHLPPPPSPPTPPPTPAVRVLQRWSQQAERVRGILQTQRRQEGEVELVCPLSDAALVLGDGGGGGGGGTGAPSGGSGNGGAVGSAWGRGGEDAAGVLRESVLGVLLAKAEQLTSNPAPSAPAPAASFAERAAAALLRLTAPLAERALDTALGDFARRSSEFNFRAAALLRDLEHIEAELGAHGGPAGLEGAAGSALAAAGGPAAVRTALAAEAGRRRAELEVAACDAVLTVYALARHNPAGIVGIESYDLERLEMIGGSGGGGGSGDEDGLAAAARTPPPPPPPTPTTDEDALGRAIMAARQSRLSPLQLALLAAAHASFERHASAALRDWTAACSLVAALGGAAGDAGAGYAAAVSALEEARARWMLSRALAGTVVCLVLTPRQFAAASAAYHPRALGMPMLVQGCWVLQQQERAGRQALEQQQQWEDADADARQAPRPPIKGALIV